MGEPFLRPNEVHKTTTLRTKCMPFISGCVAFATGGGQGLGAVFRKLAMASAIVVAEDVLEAKVHAMTEALVSDGGQAKGLRLDVGNDDFVGGVFNESAGRHGRCDILVNNAGTDHMTSIEDMRVEHSQKVVDVNFTGSFMAEKSIFPHMRKQSDGHIVNIASTAAKRAWPHAISYQASKLGLSGLSHAMYVEAWLLSIKVTAVISEGLPTPLLRDGFPDIDVLTLQDSPNVPETVRFVLLQPAETVISEIMVLKTRETSWP